MSSKQFLSTMIKKTQRFLTKMFGSNWCVNFEKIWKTLRLEFCHQKLSTFRTMNFYAFTYSPDLGSLFYPWFDEGCTFYGTFWISLLCVKITFSLLLVYFGVCLSNVEITGYFRSELCWSYSLHFDFITNRILVAKTLCFC